MLLIAAEPVPVVGDVPAVEVVLRLADAEDRPHALRVTGDTAHLRVIARALLGAADTADAASRAVARVEGAGSELE